MDLVVTDGVRGALIGQIFLAYSVPILYGLCFTAVFFLLRRSRQYLEAGIRRIAYGFGTYGLTHLITVGLGIVTTIMSVYGPEQAEGPSRTIVYLNAIIYGLTWAGAVAGTILVLSGATVLSRQ